VHESVHMDTTAHAPTDVRRQRGVCVVGRIRTVVMLVLILAVSVPHAAFAQPSSAQTALSLAALSEHTITPQSAEDDGQPLVSNPTTGTLDQSLDADDLYAVTLAAGDRLEVTLTASPGTDFDVYLLWPGTSGATDFDIAAAGTAEAYPDPLAFDVAQAGTYVLDVHALTGSSSYSVSWVVVPAVCDGETERWYGDDRYATAIDTSRNTFVDGSSHDVVVASGASFADSLTAVGLAGALRCPLLLTRPTSVPAGLIGEINRLGALDVHIVGGSKAVSDPVARSFAQAGKVVYRYGGADRYATAALVAREVAEFSSSASPEIVFVARGDLFPDALVVAPVSYAHGYPVVLTRTDVLPAATASIIDELGASRLVIAGGLSAVSAPVAQQLDALPSVTDLDRIGGSDRYQTASLIAQWATSEYRAVPAFVGIASGVNYPDALAGGAATGAHGGVVLLSTPALLSTVTRNQLGALSDLGLADTVVVFGGPSAVSEPVYTGIQAALR